MSLVFVSHSSSDKATAQRVIGRLRERGYESLFLDCDPEAGIKAGVDWERDLYRNLKMAAAVVVLCSPDSMVSRWCFAEITQARALGKALFPVVISPCVVVGSLADRQVIDMAASGEEEGFQRLFDGLRTAGLDPGDSFGWDPRRPPFPGLLYFDEADAGIFFGRDAEVRKVIEMLTRLKLPGEPRLALVVGSSGCGKSSLVRAGVLPRLAKDPARWAVVPPFRPGSDPVGELTRAVATAFPDGPGRPDWRALRDRLKAEYRAAPDGPPTLVDTADDLVMALGRREAAALFVVDQAEELLQGAAPGDVEAFLGALLGALTWPGRRAFALLTLRSDFLGTFQNHPAMRGVAFADVPIGPMPLENFPEIIDGPAGRAQLTLEPGLVATMVNDARTDDALPLLAFTLREMYERCRAEDGLTMKVYRDDLGGIQGAVGRVVERIKDACPPTLETSDALRRAFLKLVRVNDEGQYSRRPARWADLPDRAAPILEAFVQARLLSSDGDRVEVVHESLFRVWPELAKWLDEAREVLLWQRRVQEDVVRWEQQGFSGAALLRGARLAETRRWSKQPPGELTPLEVKFITASWGRAARLRWGAIFTTAAVILALGGLSAYAWRQKGLAQKGEEIAKQEKREAERQTRIATQGRLAAQSQAALAEYPERSLVLATEAFQAALRDRESPTAAARLAMHQALGATGGRVAQRKEIPVTATAFTPDGRRLITGTTNGAVRVFDLDHPEDQGVLLFGLDQSLADLEPQPGKDMGPYGNALILAGKIVDDLAVSPDGRHLGAGFGDGTIRVWDFNDLKAAPVELKYPILLTFTYMAISPDSRYLVANDEEGGPPRVWDLKDLKAAPTDLPGFKGVAKAVAMGSRGRRFATVGSGPAGKSATVQVWDLADLKAAPLSLPARAGAVTSVALGADDVLASGHSDGTVCIWNLKDTKAEPVSFKIHRSGVSGLILSPKGSLVLSAAGDGATSIWYFGRFPQMPFDLDGTRRAKGTVTKMAFTPDGKRLVDGNEDRVVRIWNVEAIWSEPEPIVLRGHEGAISTLALSRDGRRLATGSEDGVVRVWDPDVPTAQPVVSHGPTYFARTIAVSSDSRWIAAGGPGDVVISELERPRAEFARLPASVRDAEDMAMSADGQRLAITWGSSMKVWDVHHLEDKPRILPLLKPARSQGKQFSATSISPDGRYLIAGSYDFSDASIFIWDLDGPQSGPAILPGHRGPVSGLAISREGHRLVSGSWDTTAMVWNLRAEPGTKPIILSGHTEPVQAVTISPDGRHVFTASRDGTARVWDPDDPQAKLPILRGHEGAIRVLALTPDGHRLVTGGEDQTARVWDWEHPDAPPSVLRGHNAQIYEVSISPDGRRLVTVGRETLGKGDNSARLWDLEDLGAEPIVFGPRPPIVTVRFSGDNRYLVAGCGDRMIRIWQLRPEDLIAQAERTAGRNLSLAEWQQFFPGRAYRKTFPMLPVPTDRTKRGR